MTIKEAILARLAEGQALMDELDTAAVFKDGGRSPNRESVRARVYSLMKAGKVQRVRRGVYKLVKKTRRPTDGGYGQIAA